MKYLMFLSLLLSLNNVFADTEINVDDELTLADEAIQAPTIDIEGKYKIAEPVQAPAPVKEVRRIAPRRIAPAPKKLTSSDRLKLIRERLEERNRIMVEKKMEQIRFKQEMALARQLEASMNQTIKAIDNVQ